MSELYTLPDGWEWKKLGDLFTITSSKRVLKEDWLEKGIPFYRAREIVKLSQNGFVDNELFISEEMYNSFSKKYGLPKVNDILVTGVGTLGITYIVKENEKFYFKDGNIIWLKNDSNTNSKYIVYGFQTEFLKNQINSNSGSTVATYTITNANNTIIPLPPLEEQKRIVAKLDNLFAKIDKAIALHQKNIDEANVFMASVLNDVFVELEEKYGLIKINDVVVKTKNKNPLNEKDTPFTYIDISSIDNKSFKIVEPKQLIGSEAPSRAKKEVFQGDIVYSTTRPNLKNIAIVSENYNNPIASTGFCVLRTNEKTINSYLFYFLITEKLFEQIEPNIRGAQYPATSDNDLKNCNIPNTPYETQQKVVSYLDEISQKIEKIKQIQKEKMQSLKELKASILDQAFKGEL